MSISRVSLVKGWLYLGITSLVLAGMLSIILVFSRTPYIQNIFPLIKDFRVALVVHVDLSVLIWFVAFAGVLWSVYGGERLLRVGVVSLIFSALGTLIVALSPFLGASHPLINNYVPVLNDRVFLVGIALFLLGFFILSLRSLIVIRVEGAFKSLDAALHLGLKLAAVIGLMSILEIVYTYFKIPVNLAETRYYEILFWGGGHTLQFMHTLLMLIAWVLLAVESGIDFHKSSPWVFATLFLALFAGSLGGPYIFATTSVETVEFRQAFTELMEWGVGYSVVVLALIIVYSLIKSKGGTDSKHIRAALISSIFLFGAGGTIGYLISGVNVTIPAHYHGAIVGVTLAYMGLVYMYLPRLGFSRVPAKLGAIQAYLYGIGQFIHITGLAWAGGYNVQRKVTGVEQGLDTIKKIASMSLMGIGGVLAVVSGFLFLYVTIKALGSKGTSVI
ncbi:MAG: cbb3-type cytochrome c oxidase subunit I [Nitrospirae bacterium]|nr:cbb3-type cytochrome c oxidase subunit I [Nitrospirota bacterium]MBF0534578.1 cbb3-type cytochrome c oxidase subunit I [Nitrospirota bacterium]MBF0616378.1 cbb3-type cytochrome c oxidase subunit I [Nitrospirota bacterium]